MHPTIQVTAAQLYQQAQLALRFNDVEAAQRALQQAVRLEPQNVHLADAFACLLAELGDDGAQVALEHAIQLAPESGYEKYMYLAQVRTG
jgi:Flp pilus assembly protein TadD